MTTSKKIRAGDALNGSMFPLQLLPWTAGIILTCVIMALFDKIMIKTFVS